MAQDMSPATSWPKAAQVINESGSRLHARYDDGPIPGSIIRREAERLGDYARDSVLPSDYCYNRINTAAFSGMYPVFEYLGRNSYRYLGPGYPYTGTIMWKPVGQEEREVGRWIEGKVLFTHDPRRK